MGSSFERGSRSPCLVQEQHLPYRHQVSYRPFNDTSTRPPSTTFIWEIPWSLPTTTPPHSHLCGTMFRRTTPPRFSSTTESPRRLTIRDVLDRYLFDTHDILDPGLLRHPWRSRPTTFSVDMKSSEYPFVWTWSFFWRGRTLQRGHGRWLFQIITRLTVSFS